MVPAPVTVRLDVIDHGVPEAAIVHVPEPIAKVRGPVPPKLKRPLDVAKNVTLYPAASKVPLLRINTLVDAVVSVSASCKVTEPLGESIKKL